MVMLGGVTAFIYRDQIGGGAGVVSTKSDVEKPKPTGVADTSQKRTPQPAPVLPRRLLAVSVNQYLYANPTQFGTPKRNVAAWVERLADKWRIPREQAVLLTDSPNKLGSTPPIKPVIEAAIESYLASSRAQDRVVLLFAGHATIVEEKTYLVPLDGELKAKDTLIPLDWLFDKLAACKARQKVLIIDVARLDPGRGAERPSPGPLDPEIAALLRKPPEGVQVWSACSEKEQSFEYNFATINGQDVEGSLFLNSFFVAFLQGGTTNLRPEDPLPIEDMAARVNALTERSAMGLEKQKQTPFLAGKAKDGGPAPDPHEPPAEVVKIPKPAELFREGTADPMLIQGIFAEVICPPIRAKSADEILAPETLQSVTPFSAAALAEYAADYRDLDEIKKNPEKYPLRVAVLNAVEVLHRHARGDVLVGRTRKQVGLLREEFSGPTTDAMKKTIEKEQTLGPGAMYLELEELYKSLEAVGEKKADEKSKRWLAHYDYVLAMAKARFAYVNEYNFLLGKIRKDELPPLDPKLHKGWRMASVEKMTGPRDAKDQADDARKLFAKIIKEHPGTPWELLAKRDRQTALGLIWQPAAIRDMPTSANASNGSGRIVGIATAGLEY